MNQTVSTPQLSRYNKLNQLKELGGKGPVLIEGTVDEPSTVTVNGQPVEAVQLPGATTYRFEKQIEATQRQNTVEIIATDTQNNIRTDQSRALNNSGINHSS